VVLRIHVVRDGGHAYYVDDLVPGRAEGSRVAGEEPGYWWGGAAAALGQQAQVDPRAFAEVLSGRDPLSGATLRTRRPDRSVSGYDLTFGAPKSISLLHLLAPREIAEETGSAHRAAVDDALGYPERVAVGVRRARSGEVARLPSTGMVAGVFLHRTSRALDPHLHTHVVAANVAQGVDGRWSAVDSRRMFAHAAAAQALYHARLRLEIGDRLGGTFDVAPSGLGDVVGVDRSLRRLFSQRTAAMDEFRHERSVPGRSRRGAYFATRPDKDRDHTVECLRAEWRERAGTFGFDLGDLTAVVGRRRESRHAIALVDPDRLGSALDGLARHDRSLSHRDLVTEVAAASIVGAPASGIESMADHLIESGGVEVEAGGRLPSRRGSARWVAGPEPRWPAGGLARAFEDDRNAPLARVPEPQQRDGVASCDRGIGPDRRQGLDRSPARAHELSPW
jgi:conjugative relaxase-like TrwC/TraI family protein